MLRNIRDLGGEEEDDLALLVTNGILHKLDRAEAPGNLLRTYRHINTGARKLAEAVRARVMDPWDY